MASAHSRFTVAGEMSSAAGVWSIVKPPKNLHQARLLRIELLEFLQCAIECERIDGIDAVGRRRVDRLGQRDVRRLGAVLLALLAPRVIHADAPHQLRGNREEVAAVLPIDVALLEQLQAEDPLRHAITADLAHSRLYRG